MYGWDDDLVYCLFVMVEMLLCLRDHILECLPKMLWKITWLNQGNEMMLGNLFLARVQNFTIITNGRSKKNKKVREKILK